MLDVEIRKDNIMKEKVLLDTNMLVYLLDDNVLDEKITKITKFLYDSDEYAIVVHPHTFYEANKIKDLRKKEIFMSKLKVYNIIENPPRATEDFNDIAGVKNTHDLVDNDLLYALERNCVSYLISNDKELCKKGKKLGLGSRTLSIDEALEFFKSEEKKPISTPIFIREENLYNIELEDPFFSSLKMAYKGFEEWFVKKQREGKKAYITRDSNQNITSFLMLKEEGENEDYSDFEIPFIPKKRLKVSTFKVSDTGKKIGESFVKIMIEEAIKQNVDEIYITTFENQEALIYLIKQYGFEFFTYKTTITNDDTIKKECVYVKSIKQKDGYPFVNIETQGIFIIPIKPQYHKLLFEEAESEMQITFEDLQGINTSANAIRKAFICKSKIQKIRPGDIVLFYASHDKKAITSLGIVDMTWNKFETIEEISNMVRKRTAYSEKELNDVAKLNSLVIMFKHYITFKNPIKLEFLYENKILKGPPQSIVQISKSKLQKIILQSGSEEMFVG